MTNLKDLKRDWYRRLAEEGFKDIEDDRGQLKDFAGLRRVDLGGLANEYFEMASEYLANGAFDNPEERLIWEMFCDGKSIRQIEKALDVYRFKVHKILIKYQKRSGLYKWKN